jgi:large subunit ribosomal protein L9
MQVILKKDITEIGRMGEIVKVKSGYARNFLIPRSLAASANEKNVRNLEHLKRIVESNKKKVQKESEKLADGFKKYSIKLERRVNEAGKLFGSITTAEIVSELEKKEIKVDRRDVELENIKTPGTYELKVRLPGDVYASIKLVIDGIEEKSETKKSAKTKAPRKGAKKADATSEETEATAEEEVDQNETSA